MNAHFGLTEKVLAGLRTEGVPEAVLAKLIPLKGREFETSAAFVHDLEQVLAPEECVAHQDTLLRHAAGRSYVAVVTVHGVGDQEPNRTARSVANLLLNQAPGGPARYTPFEETTVRIATRKLHPGAADTGDPSQDFMRELLDGYEGEDPAAAYETIRLEGARLDAQPPTDRRRVHIYDMFWADLSQLGSGLLRLVSEFFLLVFHIGDLGRRTAKVASKEHEARRCWRGIFGVQTFAVWLLTCPIVVLNLYELAVVLLAVPLKLDGVGQVLVAGAALAIIVAVVIGKVLFRWLPRMPWWAWWGLAPLVAGAIWARLFFLWTPGAEEPKSGSYYRLLAVEWSVIVAWLLYQLLRQYARTRDQSGGLPYLTGVFAWLVGLAAWGCFVYQALYTFPDDPRRAVYTAGVRTFELLFFLVTIAWLLLFALIWLESILLGAAFLGNGPRGRQAVGTVLISILHPTALVRVLTLAGWGCVWFSLTRLKMVPTDIPYDPWIFPLPKAESMRSFGKHLLDFSGTAAFTPALLFVAVALVLSAWGLFPVVWAEVYPPRGQDRNTSDALGGWLTNGYYCLFYGGTLCMFLAVPVLFPIGYAIRLAQFRDTLAQYPVLQQLLAWSQPGGYDLLSYMSLVLSSMILGVFSLRGPLRQLGLGFHSAVRVALDVDNYMREFPYDRTPRARIFARYASLLRYLCKWRDPVDGRGYGALILVTHSQGSVITADLLRFLRRQVPRDPALADLAHIPVYLLTVGSPLRQLYGWRFPDLYRWAFHSDTSSPPLDWQIPHDQEPVPSELGVALWVNAYRSGDYVGRYLWRPSGCAYLWEPNRCSAGYDKGGNNLVRVEMCIGAGAHTHYFDETAPETGRSLDELVEGVCRQTEAAPPRYPP